MDTLPSGMSCCAFFWLDHLPGRAVDCVLTTSGAVPHGLVPLSVATCDPCRMTKMMNTTIQTASMRFRLVSVCHWNLPFCEIDNSPGYLLHFPNWTHQRQIRRDGKPPCQLSQLDDIITMHGPGNHKCSLATSRASIASPSSSSQLA